MNKVIKETVEEHLLKDMARLAEMVETGQLSATAGKQVLNKMFKENPIYLAYFQGALDA